MNILQAIQDDNLFRPFLGDDLSSWRNWEAALACLYGLPVRKRQQRRVVRQCTGRMIRRMPENGFSAALFLCGRRSGKSRIAAIAGAYEAILGEHERHLSPGEIGVVAVLSPTRVQSRIVYNYMRSLFQIPLLAAEVAHDDKSGFQLKSGIRCEVLTGCPRSVRGHSLVACIVDEIAYFGLEEESRVRNDSEVIRAVEPALATAQGKLICIGSPYARKGWSYSTFKRNHSNDSGRILVWTAASRTMNPTLEPAIVDAALAEDPQAAKAEWLAEFREDVAEFLPRTLIEGLVAEGRTQLLPTSKRH